MLYMVSLFIIMVKYDLKISVLYLPDIGGNIGVSSGMRQFIYLVSLYIQMVMYDY